MYFDDPSMEVQSNVFDLSTSSFSQFSFILFESNLASSDIGYPRVWVTYFQPSTHAEKSIWSFRSTNQVSLSMLSLDHWEGSRLQKWEEDSCLWWQIWGMCLPILFLRIRTHDQFQESWYRGLEKVHLSGTDAGFVQNWRRFLQTTKNHIQSLVKIVWEMNLEIIWDEFTYKNRFRHQKLCFRPQF